MCLLPLFAGRAQLFITTEIMIFALYALSFNLILGYGGLLSIGHSIFLGVGAYITGVLLKNMPQFPFLGALVIGTLGTTMIGFILGSLLLKQKGPAFALLTFAFSGMFMTIAIKWRSVTGGDDGIIVFRPMIDLGFIELDTTNPTIFYYICFVIIGFSVFLLWRFTRTAMGHTVLLLRENDGRMQFLGYNPSIVRLILFTVSSAFAGLAGSFYMLFFGSVAYNVIGIEMTAIALLMSFIGGIGNFVGPILGAIFYIYVQDFLSGVTDRWPFFMGVIFIVMVMYQPEGLAGLISKLVSSLRGLRGDNKHPDPKNSPGGMVA
jgi:branched-chain amino acid transport system permease protein